MKKFRDFLSRPAVTATLLALALVLLAGSTLGGIAAAPMYESLVQDTEMNLKHIGVALYENDKEVPEGGTLLKDLLKRNGNDPKHKNEKKYSEVLTVKNTGTINEYVRVTVYKYWKAFENDRPNAKLVKKPEMDANWIELGFVEGNGWTIDHDADTEERTVLYYATPLAPNEISKPFLDSITIKEEATHDVTKKVDEENGVITSTWTYDYNGAQFCVEAHVDGVQDHNMEKAKISAWGVKK